MKCHGCGQYGHPVRRCPQRECWKCGKWGHVQADCRSGWSQQRGQGNNGGQKGNGKGVRYLKDGEDDEQGESLNLLERCQQEPALLAVEAKGEQMIKFIVDSGAAETVIPKGILKQFPTSPGRSYGVKYRGADGSAVENEGEKLIRGTIGGLRRRITAQVCQVSKPLYSVRQAVQAGYDVTFSQTGSGMKHRVSGKQIPFKLKDGMYVLEFETQSGFTRQGANA